MYILNHSFYKEASILYRKSYNKIFINILANELWTPWGEWGACSVTCGGGGQRRYRTCETKNIQGHHSGTVNHCTGSSYRKRRCNTQCCPGN